MDGALGLTAVLDPLSRDIPFWKINEIGEASHPEFLVAVDDYGIENLAAAKYYFNETLLHYYAKKKSMVEAVKMLIDAGADVNVMATLDDYPETPLDVAARYNNLGCVRILLQAGASVRGQTVNTHVHPNMIKLLLESPSSHRLSVLNYRKPESHHRFFKKRKSPSVKDLIQFLAGYVDPELEPLLKAAERNAIAFEKKKALLRFGLAAGDAGHKDRVAAQRRRGIEPGPDFY